MLVPGYKLCQAAQYPQGRALRWSQAQAIGNGVGRPAAISRNRAASGGGDGSWTNLPQFVREGVVAAPALSTPT